MPIDRVLPALLVSLLACDAGRAPPPILEATTSRAVADGDDPAVVAPDAVTTPALGAREPLVVVMLFTDYQCPNCKRMHDIAARLAEGWPDEVQVQFRQLPLQSHPLSRPTALAALAAHRQGRFACMNTALVRSRTSWNELDTARFVRYAMAELVPRCGLAPDRFLRDLDDPALAAKVESDYRLAVDAGVKGTPTILVDGLTAQLWPMPGVKPSLVINALVRRSLREAESQLESGASDRAGLPAERLYGNIGDADIAMRLLDQR